MVHFEQNELVCFYVVVLDPPSFLLDCTNEPAPKEVAKRGRLLNIEAGVATVQTMDGMKYALPVEDIYKLPPGTTTIR